MSEHSFSLRTAQPADSAAIAALITELDGDVTTRFLIDAYTAITSGTDERTCIVVAECEGNDGLVGMGTVRFGSVQYNGQVLPFAGLDGLKVRAPFRGQGLGRKLAEWRVEQARQAYGEECVVITGLLRSNHASRAVATKWSREFIEPVRVVIMPIRQQPPHPLENITVREIESRDYSEFATQQNRFYREYNLYKPTDPTVIANCLQIIAAERQMYRLFVAVDTAGNLLAGARLWLRGLLKVDVINQFPSVLRLLNPILHVLPADYTIRDIVVEGFWHAPGQERVARYLWEAMRWHCAAFGSTLVISVDPGSPLLNIFQLKPWHQPRIEVAYAVHGPVPRERHRLVCGFNRV